MYPLLETIRFENGSFSNIDYHIRRMKNAVETCLKKRLTFDPEKILKDIAANNKTRRGLYKFRFLYDFDQYDREFVPYRLPSIKTLNPVWTDDIDYSCKWTDRTRLQALAEQKGEAGDVLIIKNGLVTDTSFANLVFFDGNRWLTPETPLLKGTQRAFLLDQGLIEEQRITYEDLDRFEEIRIINAMIRLEDQLSVVVLKR